MARGRERSYERGLTREVLRLLAVEHGGFFPPSSTGSSAPLKPPSIFRKTAVCYDRNSHRLPDQQAGCQPRRQRRQKFPATSASTPGPVLVPSPPPTMSRCPLPTGAVLRVGQATRCLVAPSVALGVVMLSRSEQPHGEDIRSAPRRAQRIPTTCLPIARGSWGT